MSDEPSTAISYEFDCWTLSVTERELKDSRGIPCQLTATEFNILLALVSNANLILTREHILAQLGDKGAGLSDRTVDNHIAQIRAKLQQASTKKLIKTIRGSGYVFAETITKQDGSAGTSKNAENRRTTANT